MTKATVTKIPTDGQTAHHALLGLAVAHLKLHPDSFGFSDVIAMLSKACDLFKSEPLNSTADEAIAKFAEAILRLLVWQRYRMVFSADSFANGSLEAGRMARAKHEDYRKLEAESKRAWEDHAVMELLRRIPLAEHAAEWTAVDKRHREDADQLLARGKFLVNSPRYEEYEQENRDALTAARSLSGAPNFGANW